MTTKKALFLLSLCTIGCFFASANITHAEVTSDGTVNTQVNRNGSVDEITGGETRGDNLFHSFQDFSVPTGNEAFFDNASDIANIFSRVTGGNISNIDGLIRANGSASLFLINPAGIVFGEGARLDIGGSFYGSSASSILFEDGEFSAVDLDNPPLLTVNAPIGLGFRDEPGDMVNRSIVENSNEEVIGLEVSAGNNLTFVGGNLNFEGGNLTASGGNIFLGGLSQAGTVDIDEDGRLSFPESLTLADISLSNAAEVNVAGAGGGAIDLVARNLSLTAGEGGESFIRGGIAADSTSSEAQGGDITISVAEGIVLNESRILNQVESGAIGNSGKIALNTGSIELINGSQVSASTFGRGNAGTVNVTATDDITIDGEGSSDSPFGIASAVASSAEGNSEGITISTGNLSLKGGGQVTASTGGKGDAGAVKVTATGEITLEGENSRGFASSISSFVNPDAEGDSGDITLSTGNLSLKDGSQVSASTFSTGNAGAVEVTATEAITVEGEKSSGFVSNISSFVNPDAEGNSGGITISTGNLSLQDGGRVSADTFGKGDAGAVKVTATGDLTAEGEDSGGSPSGITSLVNSNAEGNSRGITISTGNLSLKSGGRVTASTFSEGDAGAVKVTAKGEITAEGETSGGSPSGITSLVNSNAEGNSGDVTIFTDNLSLKDGSRVTASTFGMGDAGSVNVIATGDLIAEGENSNGTSSRITSQVNRDSSGDSGDVTIFTDNLSLKDGSQVSASTFGNGNAGSVKVTASGNLSLKDGSLIFASTFGNGNAGSVEIHAEGDVTFDGEDSSRSFGSGAYSRVNPGAVGNAGGVTILAANLILTNGGIVDASTFSRGNAGSLEIKVTESIFISGAAERFRSGILANAQNEDGNGGNISVNTGSLTISDGGTIEATNFDNIGENNPGTGRPGNISITTNSLDLSNSARIEAATQFEGEQSGIINLQIAENLTLDNNSFISAQAFENAEGGNLSIDAGLIIAFPSSGSGNDLVATAEDERGGNINLDAEQVFGLQPGRAIAPDSQNNFIINQSNDIDASSNVDGLEGNININIRSVDPLQGATELPVDVVEPGETTQQACASDRESVARSNLTISGKGGVPQAPDLPLNSLNTTASNDNFQTDIPAPIETSQGKIQPARGIEVTEDGVIRLTAYRTNGAGERIGDRSVNCGGV